MEGANRRFVVVEVKGKIECRCTSADRWAPRYCGEFVGERERERRKRGANGTAPLTCGFFRSEGDRIEEVVET